MVQIGGFIARRARDAVFVITLVGIPFVPGNVVGTISARYDGDRTRN